MSTATVRTGIDTTVDSAQPTRNLGNVKTLSVRNNPDNWALLWFKNPAPRLAVVQSATLYVYSKGAWPGGSTTMSVQRIAGPWYESLATWAKRPALVGAARALTQSSPHDLTEWAFDVTSIAQAWQSGAINYGIALVPGDSDSTRRDFYSLEQGGTHAPRLVVTWSDAPNKPTTLHPSSGAVSIAQPTLTFDYTDVSGSTTLAAAQVQIDAGGNFVTPAWDSHTVVTTEPQLDLSTTTYPGLALNASTYWRVRVQDAAGLWSPWSDPARFSRVAKSALSLDNPPPGDSFVSEYTPEIAWTFGGTQTAVRVRIIDVETPTKLLLDKVIPGTGNSYTLPNGVLTRDGHTYRLTLDVWDNVDREYTPGDFRGVTIVRDFVVRYDSTPDNPTGLAVDFDVLGKPYATLRWSRSTAPDAFNVLRNGRVIAHNLDPADCNTGATTYKFTDRSPTPNVPQTWTVQAVVNGTTTSGAHVSGTMRLGALWVVDTANNQLVALLDTSFDAAMVDLAGVYEPVGADSVVRVVQTLRGPQGTLGGRLADFAGMSVADFEAALLWMKERPTNDVQILVGTKSYRAVIGDVSIAPSSDRTGDLIASLSWWSLDGVDS